MRSLGRARGVGSALALLVILSSAPAGAQKRDKRKPGRTSVTECASFAQKDAGDAAVDFTVTNTCPVALECSVTWSVTCAPDTARRSKKYEGSSFTLVTMDARTTTASAARCGDDGWSIDDVSWSCAPSKKPVTAPAN